LLDKPVFGNLEKPRVGRRDRVPTQAETEAILARASLQFRLIYSALRQCGARPGELCRVTISDVDRVNRVITLKEHKTARKTGQPRRIPIGRRLGEFLDQATGDRTEGPVFLCPSGRRWRVENLSRTYSRLRDAAGLSKDLVLYLARHECGTTYRRQTTSSYSSCNREGARPILPVAALLRLADWCRQRALIQGEESCEQARKDWFPPAQRNTDSCGSAERTVAGRTQGYRI
jgi:integrase